MGRRFTQMVLSILQIGVYLRPDFCTIKVDLRWIDIFPYHALDQHPEQKQ